MQHSLRGFNSFGVECLADEFVSVRSEADLQETLVDAKRRGIPVTILGGGTNVLCLARIPGRVVHIEIHGMSFTQLENGQFGVSACAGESWHELVHATLERGITGLENLALIPGTVGAAPMQNIGAYGRELAGMVHTVRVYDRDADGFVEMPASECGFAYRDSVFKNVARNKYVVTALNLRLGGLPLETSYPDVALELERLGLAAPSAVQVAEAVTRIRLRKLPQPAEVGNAGSFFKNPTVDGRQLETLRKHLKLDAFAEGAQQHKISAARLIDAAGWKGHRTGDAAVWRRQPLVIVNLGGASGHEILALAMRIKEDVAQRYDVELEFEPTVLGQEA